jgi:hypothetical protein
MKNITNCCVCGDGKLKNIISLNKFPITGIFNQRKKLNCKSYDLNLSECNKCNHLQLKKLVSKNILYDSRYYNRTGKSHLSLQAYDYFKKFIFKNKKSTYLGNLLEIGCNDITMLKKFSKYSKKSLGIDPIWRGQRLNFGKIKVLGKFIEDVNFKKDIKFVPDTIISTHNLEHIEDPFSLLNNLSKSIKDNGMIFIEVPDATTMIKKLRYDQIFHQHYHYFTLISLKNLASRAGLELIDHDLNKFFWGGSLMVALRKTKKNNKKILKNKTINSLVKINFKKFKDKYKKIKYKINNSKNLLGYGAGQMTPTFAYHLNSKFHELDYILDDDKSKNNRYYPGIKPKILFASNFKFDKNYTFLITALDGVTPIKKKLRMNKLNDIISI